MQKKSCGSLGQHQHFQRLLAGCHFDRRAEFLAQALGAKDTAGSQPALVGQARIFQAARIYYRLAPSA